MSLGGGARGGGGVASEELGSRLIVAGPSSSAVPGEVGEAPAEVEEGPKLLAKFVCRENGALFPEGSPGSICDRWFVFLHWAWQWTETCPILRQLKHVTHFLQNAIEGQTTIHMGQTKSEAWAPFNDRFPLAQDFEFWIPWYRWISPIDCQNDDNQNPENLGIGY
jgi:hypothetical protein